MTPSLVFGFCCPDYGFLQAVPPLPGTFERRAYGCGSGVDQGIS